MSRSQANPGAEPAHLPPAEIDSIFSQGIAFHRAGLLPEAEQLYRRVLQGYPQHFDSLHLLGVICYQRGQYAEAARQIDQALKIKPDVADAYNNRGNALKKLGRFDEALASYNQAIAFKPDDAGSFNNRGSVLKDLKRLNDALSDFDNAIALKPDFAEAFNNRGNVLFGLNRFEEALANYDRAIVLKSDNADAYNNRGTALNELYRFAEALKSYDQAIALKPDFVEAYYNRGIALSHLQRRDEALASYDKTTGLQADHADAYNNRAILLADSNRFDEALVYYARAIALKPDIKYLKGLQFQAKMHVCDWSDFEQDCARLHDAVAQGVPAAYPFQLLTYSLSPQDQLKCAEIYVADKCIPAAPLWRGERYGHQRIRVAYLSTDLSEHPITYLTAGLFARHDRTRFETIAISMGPETSGPMHDRLKASFDRFVEAQAMNDHEVAKLVRSLEVDIVVDLNGFTHGSRPNIFAQRPAPVQVNYLGFAATLGRSNWDYIIADRFVIPEQTQVNFGEQVVYLPDTFMATDDGRNIAARVPSRKELGLPDSGLVFCCFNNTFKITPNIFGLWMRLLRQIEGSVLWLSAANNSAPNNLRHEAESRGVSADRLIFAPRIQSSEDHLARQQVADLFLDTFPYNAHATGSDALWAGLPVLTCAGPTFASRVAGSLLTAVGLPELITTSLPEYEAMALKLARDPALLASIRQKLARNRQTEPLFNTGRFTRHIEAAYAAMWERSQRGERPQGFAVAPIG